MHERSSKVHFLWFYLYMCYDFCIMSSHCSHEHAHVLMPTTLLVLLWVKGSFFLLLLQPRLYGWEFEHSRKQTLPLCVCCIFSCSFWWLVRLCMHVCACCWLSPSLRTETDIWSLIFETIQCQLPKYFMWCFSWPKVKLPQSRCE